MYHLSNCKENDSTFLENGKSNEAKTDKITKKSPKFTDTIVKSKFFTPKTTFSTPLTLKTIMNKRSEVIKIENREIHRASIIYSEDVSRKNTKLDKSIKPKRFKSTTSNSDTADFLENLKKNIDRESMSKQIEVPRARKIIERRKKALFNDESLRLMNNFKDFYKGRNYVTNNDDTQDQSIATGQILMKSHSSICSFANQENIANRDFAPENLASSVYPPNLSSSERNLPKLHSQMSLTSEFTVPALNTNRAIDMPQIESSETNLTTTASLLSTPTLSYNTTMLIKANNNIDITCPTPSPLIPLTSRYNSTKKDNALCTIYKQSYF